MKHCVFVLDAQDRIADSLSRIINNLTQNSNFPKAEGGHHMPISATTRRQQPSSPASQASFLLPPISRTPVHPTHHARLAPTATPLALALTPAPTSQRPGRISLERKARTPRRQPQPGHRPSLRPRLPRALTSSPGYPPRQRLRSRREIPTRLQPR